EHRLALSEARFEGMAAELADQLEAGQECPVCGSVEHPRRGPGAQSLHRDPSGPTIDVARIDVAQRAESTAYENWTRAEADRAQARAQLDLARRTLGDHTAATLRTDHRAANQELERATAAQQRLPSLRADLERATAELTGLLADEQR